MEGTRQQLAGFGRRDDLHRPIRHALGQRRVKGHELGVDLHRVGVERRENRRVLVQFEIGLVNRHLRGVDGLGDGQALFLKVTPGFVAQALALPERGIGEALGARDHDAVDVALQTAIGHREAELLAIGISGAQVETCFPQPSDHAVLHDVTTLEDAQHPAWGVTPVVDRSLGVLELQRTLAGHPEA